MEGSTGRSWVIGHTVPNNGKGRWCEGGSGFGYTGNSHNVGSSLRGRGSSNLQGVPRFTKGGALSLLGVLKCLSCHLTTGMDAKVCEMIRAVAMRTEKIAGFSGFANGRECFRLQAQFFSTMLKRFLSLEAPYDGGGREIGIVGHGLDGRLEARVIVAESVDQEDTV